jgi:hypothetical protein
MQVRRVGTPVAKGIDWHIAIEVSFIWSLKLIVAPDSPNFFADPQ